MSCFKQAFQWVQWLGLKTCFKRKDETVYVGVEVEVEASRQAHIHPFHVQPEQIKASLIPTAEP